MNAPIWIAWVVVAVFSIISIILLMGKGSFLIAGYNTASKEKRQKYNAKRLCRVVGGGLGILAIILGISVFFKFDLPSAIAWIMPWGYLVTIMVIAVLANTVCKVNFKQKAGD